MDLYASSVEFCLPENPLPQRLQIYRVKNKFTDAKIKVGVEEFPAHRIVLEDSSPVLKALLSDNWSTKDNVYEFGEEFISSAVVEDLLTFFYTSKLTLTTDNAHSICIASHFLNVPTLLSASEEFLSERVSSSNVLDLLLLSDKLELETLRKKCAVYFCENHQVVLTNPKLIGFTIENFQMIIRELNKQEIVIGLKEVLFESLISWVEYDLLNRSSSLPTLLKSLPLHELSHRFLSEVVAKKNIISNSFPCTKLVLEALSELTLNPSEIRTNKFYCLGGMNGKENYLCSMSNLDFSTGKWDNSKAMSTARANFGGAVIRSKIYLCGGLTTDGVKLATVEVFDHTACTSTQLQAMPEARSNCAAAALDQFIYVSGGIIQPKKNISAQMPVMRSNADGSLSYIYPSHHTFHELNYNSMQHIFQTQGSILPLVPQKSNKQATSSVIRYSIGVDEWQPVKSMNHPRYNHQLVQLDYHLYAIGGETNVVERYYPGTDTWTGVANTKYIHENCGAASINRRIYVLSNAGFEVFCPESNTCNSLTPLQEYSGRTLLSVNEKLYALGGGKEQATKSMFEFDTATERWRQLPDMDIARQYHCSFFINC